MTRVLVAKVGFDGHDRGIKVVARILRDAGFEVIFVKERETTENIAATALQEDVDAIGLSMHNGAHLTLTPAVVDALRAVGLTTPVVVGGIVPAVDVPKGQQAGAVAVLGPGASSKEIVATVKAACAGEDGRVPGPA